MSFSFLSHDFLPYQESSNGLRAEYQWNEPKASSDNNGFFPNDCNDSMNLASLMNLDTVVPSRQFPSQQPSFAVYPPYKEIDTLGIINDSIEITSFEPDAFEPIPIQPPSFHDVNTNESVTFNADVNANESVTLDVDDSQDIEDYQDPLNQPPLQSLRATSPLFDSNYNQELPLPVASSSDDSRKRERLDMADEIDIGPKRKRISLSSSSVCSEDDDAQGDAREPRFRDYQKEQWHERFQELVDFHAKHGHAQVPHTLKENRPLARWVKRQRYQYRLKIDGKQSAMTQERVELLEKLGFVWDSHGAAWEDRLKDLEEFKNKHKHCNVPSNYPQNSSLASWVKCQRRQYKLFREGKPSNINLDRIIQLEKIGFEWELRCGKTRRW